MATEKRLIDANATFELLRSLGSRDYRREKGTIMDAMKMISHPEYTPTVDAVEVVHGHWVDNMVRDWHCSECGKKVPRQVYFDGYCYNDKLNYCPNCGAKMDGGA